MSEVKIAVLGCGRWGKNLVRNFAELGALGAIFDAHPPTAEKMSETYNVPAKSIEDILADDTIQGVVIAAPAALHAELALQALAAGKHVYVEKPLALNETDSAKIVAAAKAANRILMVGHLLHYHAAFADLKKRVLSGEIGKLRHIISTRFSYGTLRHEEDVLLSFSPHDISMVLSLTGEEPSSVQATLCPHLQPNIADFATTQLTFPNGATAEIRAGWLSPYKEHKMVVIGEKGAFVFDDTLPWENKLTKFTHDVDWKQQGDLNIPVTVKGEAQPVPITESEPLKTECQHFLDCIANGNTPITDGEEGLRVIKVLAKCGVLEQNAPAQSSAA